MRVVLAVLAVVVGAAFLVLAWRAPVDAVVPGRRRRLVLLRARTVRLLYLLCGIALLVRALFSLATPG